MSSSSEMLPLRSLSCFAKAVFALELMGNLTRVILAVDFFRDFGGDGQYTTVQTFGGEDATWGAGEGRGGFGNRKEASEYHQELRKRLPGWSGGETGAAVSLAASGAATRSAAAAADAD